MSNPLVLIGAGQESVFAVERAKGLGYAVLATDRNRSAPGASLADFFLPLSVYDPEETVRGIGTWAAQEGRTPGGVLCVAVDAPRTVAAVGEAFNLPAVSVETARLATDKLSMKDRFKAAGINIPWYAAVRDAQDVAAAVREKGYPLVVKPVDSRGARGVLRLTPDVDVEWAFATAKSVSPTGRVMVERFLPGPQVSTEGLMVRQTAHIPGFADRNYEFLERFAPFIIENGGDMPSLLPSAAQREIIDLTGRAALALGLEHGPVKGDMLWHDGKAYVIEIAARHSGGYFATHEIPWSTGVDLLGLSIRMAMGELPAAEDLRPKYGKGVSQRYLFPSPGVVTAVNGIEAARAMPDIRYLEVRVRPGDVIEPTTSHPARPGLVMAVAETREKAGRAALAAVNAIEIQTVRE
jgi:biotin carboxylase